MSASSALPVSEEVVEYSRHAASGARRCRPPGSSRSTYRSLSPRPGCSQSNELSQGEFVTVSKLEAAYGAHPAIRQIFVYGNSARSYLLTVIVPTDATAGKNALSEALQTVARESGLQSYESPRDFIVETTPFTLENGLLTGIRKLARPQVKEHCGPALEQLYVDLTLEWLERMDRPILAWSKRRGSVWPTPEAGISV